jgi:hypothetical protein
MIFFFVCNFNQSYQFSYQNIEIHGSNDKFVWFQLIQLSVVYVSQIQRSIDGASHLCFCDSSQEIIGIVSLERILEKGLTLQWVKPFHIEIVRC